MCKIIEYWFACQHGFQLRISQCGGTRHRKVRGELVAACKSESYLNIVFPIDCGPCQHQTFEKGWNRKLESAKMFQDKLREKEMPGMQEVAALVDQLEDDFNTASWNTRAVFPHLHKERSVRVSLGHFKKASSPLRQEVLPEDIREPPEVIDPNHPDHEYDWDYVASTDPLHPVDVNYTHPLEEVDPCWMLNHLSPEEFEQASGEVGFDANEVDTMWAGSLEESILTSTTWNKDGEDWDSETISPNRKNYDPGQDLEVQTGLASPIAHTEKSTKEKQMLEERIAMVIHEFWRVVNDEDPCKQRPQYDPSTLSDDLFDGMNELSILGPSSDPDTLHTGLLTPPRTPPRFMTDGSYDSHFISTH